MSAMLLIARRELGGYFRSMTGYVIAGLVLLIDGLLFNAFVLSAGEMFSADVLSNFFYISSGTTMIASPPGWCRPTSIPAMFTSYRPRIVPTRPITPGTSSTTRRRTSDPTLVISRLPTTACPRLRYRSRANQVASGSSSNETDAANGGCPVHQASPKSATTISPATPTARV